MDKDLPAFNSQDAQESITADKEKTDFNNQYGVPVTPLHTHDGNDSPRINTNNLTGYQVFAGSVASDGTGTFLPPGWTSSYSGGSKLYTVVHSIGTTNYSVVITPISNSDRIPLINTIASTSFSYTYTQADGGAAATSEGNFIVVKP